MNVLVLGPGCDKCQKLFAAAEQAVENVRCPVPVRKVEDAAEIAKAGVMVTPALVINGAVKASGRLPEVSEIEGWLREACGR